MTTNTVSLAMSDWIVVALYGIGMILVGWYYSRRTSSTEDYLLGGRNMRPWAVGLSMFATLFSTLSYLSYPGEVIAYGPMLLAQIAAYPLIFLVVGWLLIPYIMKLKITTAYEILDLRFGASIHLLGALIFLTIRLLWMATILYVTTSKALIPMVGWPPSSTPWVCAALGLVTVIYTSLGGIRAVVVTDVVQTAILFSGAAITLSVITWYFGGVTNWWPKQAYEHWSTPVWGLDTSARVSFVGMVISTFTWYVCTSGSDQMAIQRYLATRNVRTARRVLLVSLLVDALVLCMMVLLGLALLAYFLRNPDRVPAGQSLFQDADKMFSYFVVTHLPSGVTGMVVAGLLAAAMSSLSSGVNSSCAVITVDFLDRLRRRRQTKEQADEDSEMDHVKMARWISVAVGAVVVGLSLYVSLVPGNIMELCYRIVSLFVAPLFLLFFMAMFVPWATTFGAWVGGLTGVTVALLVGFWNEIFPDSDSLSFLWIMPNSFLAGAIAGMLASLLPIGPPARRLLVAEESGGAG